MSWNLWPIEQIYNHINGSRYIEIKGAGHYIWLRKNELGGVLRILIQTIKV